MIEVISIAYQSKHYFEQLEVRREQLRRPLGMDYTEDYLEAEKNEVFLAAIDQGKVVGSLIVQHLNEKDVRFRQIAVSQTHQGKGVGLLMVQAAEKLAAEQNYKNIIINSRQGVIGFYEKAGYVVTGDLFVELTIPHVKMEKKL